MNGHEDLTGKKPEKIARAKNNWRKLEVTVKAANRFESSFEKFNEKIGFVKDKKHEDPFHKMVNTLDYDKFPQLA